MARDAVAALIHWEWIIAIFGILNPCFMLPQLMKIWVTQHTEGISMITLVLLISIQAAFSLHGFFIRDVLVMWSSGVAGLVSLSVALSTVYIRQRT